MTVMLYKAPGPHKIHGRMFDYVVVEEDEVSGRIDDGWHMTTPDAYEASLKAQVEEAAPKRRGRPPKQKPEAE